MRKTPGLSTDFAGIRREIAGISRRQFGRVWRNILRDGGVEGAGGWLQTVLCGLLYQ
jgi:hypothetical protein